MVDGLDSFRYGFVVNHRELTPRLRRLPLGLSVTQPSLRVIFRYQHVDRRDNEEREHRSDRHTRHQDISDAVWRCGASAGNEN